MLARIRKAQEENEGGFTLIELLVVIIIIGILAAIAIPVFLNQRQKGYDAAAKSDARNLATLEETYLTDTNSYLAAGSATDTTTLAGALATYKPSSNVSGAIVRNYSNDSPPVILAAGTNGSGGYQICTTSASTKIFVYDSTKGGLQPAGTACQ